MSEEHDEIALDDITIDDVVAGDTADAITDGLDLPMAEPEKEETEEEVPEEIQEESEEESEEVPEEFLNEDPQEDEEEEYKEETEEDGEETEPTVVSEVLERLGYEIEGEYEDTPEGLTQMTKDVASQMADDRIDEVLEKFPLVKQHLEYVLQGGESQQFMSAHDPRADYGTFELNEKDTASQRAILANYFELKGHDKEFTNELLEDYEDSGKLFKKAAAAKEALGKYQEQQRESMYEHQREEQQKQFEQERDFWDGISDTLKGSQEFAGVTIPERDKSKFFNYISTPVNQDGNTQRDLDHANAEVDVKLAIDYLMYKGFNLDDIINRKANTKSVQTLRNKISSRQESVKSAKRNKRRTTAFNVDDLDLDI
jgi:exosome complex component RRP41